MCEVTASNFAEKLPEILKSLDKSKFVSVDLEFSALHPLQSQQPSLFDSNRERYTKLRKNLEHVVPLQVGLTAFHYDSHKNDYFAEVYTFYVFPASFVGLDKSFYFQSSSTKFLCLHNFDFNKFAYLGVPYINKVEESDLRQKLKSSVLVGENCNLRYEYSDVVRDFTPRIETWFRKSQNGETLEIREIAEKYGNFPELIYFFHKYFRNKFKHVWTYRRNDSFYIKKVSQEELHQLLKHSSLEDDLVSELIGFTHVFRKLISLKKPLIGHNLMQDIMLMINSFEAPLPKTYSQFKTLAHEMFPSIFDTKTLYYELKSSIPKSKLPDDTSLQMLFDYFKDGLGRHLVMNCSAIESNVKSDNVGKYHHAGWDSFAAGYIFVRMGYYNIALKYPKSKEFVSSEIIGGLAKYKNWVNIIRGSSAHIIIDGEDPVSNRPPWLIVESVKREPLDMIQLSTLLSSYGFVDIKKISTRGDRVLVAVDNFRTAKDISRSFRTNPTFQVKQYNILKHSPAIQGLLLAAVTISGTLLVWFSHKIGRK